MDLNKRNRVGWFFGLYILLFGSLILGVTFLDFSKEKPNKQQNQVRDIFNEELEKQEKKMQAKQERIKERNKFNVSKEFAMLAVSIAAILDIIIVVLWARHQNRKAGNQIQTSRKRWTDSNWFWNIIAMGVIQRKENRYVINWVNTIGVGMLIHFLFYFLYIKN